MTQFNNTCTSFFINIITDNTVTDQYLEYRTV